MLSSVALAPPQYALAPGASPRPDMMQGAGTYALAAAMPRMVAEDPFDGIDLQDLHIELVEKFEASEDSSRANREKAERDIDYYDGKQWDEKDAKKLRDRGQPVIAKNRIRRKIDYMQGLERSQRTEPRALPRTPQHEEDAHSATDALRSVTEQNRYDQVRSKVWKDKLSAGWGGVEVVTEEREGDVPRIITRRCQWDRMFWDPYSAEEDFSDVNYLGLVVWMDRVAAVRRYGADAAKVFDETLSSVTCDSYDDKPKNFTWVDNSKRKRVRIVQMYYKDDDGRWMFCEFTKGGFLKMGVSPWLDDDGKPEHPYAWRSANIDRDNNRYGVIRDMIDTQDEINKRASKALHLVSVRQTYGTEGLLGNQTQKEMRQQLTKPDGHISLNQSAEWGKNFGIIPTTDLAQGNFELLAEAKAELDLQGPNSAMLGKGPAGASGRAILANQQGGAIEQTPLTDALRDMDHEVYRKIWRRIRQFWDAETWVRITDDEKNVRFVQLNAPAVDPMTGGPVFDPQTGKPVIERPVAALEVDIIIDDAPLVGTMLDEQFGLLVELKKMDTNGEIPFKAIIKAAPNLRNKAEILEEIAQREQQPPDPMQEQAKQIALASEQAKIGKTKADEVNAYASASQKIGQLIMPPPDQGMGQPQQMPPDIAQQQLPPQMPPGLMSPEQMSPQAPPPSGVF